MEKLASGSKRVLRLEHQQALAENAIMKAALEELSLMEHVGGAEQMRKIAASALENTTTWRPPYIAHLFHSDPVLEEYSAPTKYRLRPLEFEATQWFERGDHPDDGCKFYDFSDRDDRAFDFISFEDRVRGKTHSEGDPMVVKRCDKLWYEQWWDKRKWGFYRDMIRPYKSPEDVGHRRCRKCANRLSDHGWIEDRETGSVVCPGDFVVTGVNRRYFAVSREEFEITYEEMCDETFSSSSVTVHPNGPGRSPDQLGLG